MEIKWTERYTVGRSGDAVTLTDSDGIGFISEDGFDEIASAFGYVKEEVKPDPRTSDALALVEWLEGNEFYQANWNRLQREWYLENRMKSGFEKSFVHAATIPALISAANAKLHPEPVETEAEAEAWIIAEASKDSNKWLIIGGAIGDERPRIRKQSNGWTFYRPKNTTASHAERTAVAAKAAYLKWKSEL